ncbi:MULTISPECIES: histidine--tRNA ligase [Metabacillus]|jgi:histidyl-tRNA synthetase|uniref:Histidine--tRNA ligase n=1 Tax=Metabacillus hrfriensis TaxID=3048891 RepID=A0ACD4R846_9BACI|nr:MULTISPECIES: histidine--tRNA ligase [Metabacillus]UAL51150.1 histidine--tRNA ligase [Metabacillus dongyingensis]UOK57125.1 histidine--tRNA ligase [Bacillus sp. OVS6]USK27443.1 histidine--tRNA ligase [Bacillus sp. CMF21]WHZ56655.1 histidine--tRNA ligase [Metabacillus sp. CT-WN-B3]
MSFQIPRGTQDILPGDVERWQYIENTAREICRLYQYKEIRTPIFEHTELFQRGVGESTDIVQKEMYTFQDRKGRSLTLRPEGTASTVRAFVEKKLYAQPAQPTKLYYIGPMFRYERPQTGRFRQFVQFGVEALGSNSPAIDAEVISLAMELYSAVGLKKLKLIINSLGDADSRKAHREALIAHFEPRIGEFCSDCQKRLQQNPLRILDCKVDRNHELMGTAPSIMDYLNDESKAYFNKVQQYLTDLNIEFTVDPNLVRGLDYYNHTAFEIMSDAEGFGAITTLCGGGRYNGLVEDVGGPETPGIGFGLSIERFLAALDAENVELPIEQSIDCFVVALGDKAKDRSVSLVYELRKAGLTAEKDYEDKKMKAQFKAADRFKAKFVAVLGDDEIEKNIISVKNMETGSQVEVALDELTAYIKG